MTAKHFKLTDAAAADVESIYLQGLAEFGEEQADRYHDGLFNAFQFLADFPNAARVREELPGNVRVHRYRSHVVVYRKEPDGGVLIVRIWHGHQDWQTDLTH